MAQDEKIELWGNDACIACDQARKLLQKTPLVCKYVDVANTGFEGVIPRLVFDTGRHIVGLGPINSFVKQRMRDLGFPEGML